MDGNVYKEMKSVNDSIVAAIKDGDYTRAIEIDTCRKKILVDLCEQYPNNVSDDIFDLIEECAGLNAAMISEVQGNMESFTAQRSKEIKLLRAYTRGKH